MRSSRTFLAQPRQFLTLRRREAGLAFRPIRAGLLDPVPERRLRQAQIARRGRDRLALIEDQSYRPRLVVIREAPPRPPALRVRHGRHRIPLSEDVHQTGSWPILNLSHSSSARWSGDLERISGADTDSTLRVSVLSLSARAARNSNLRKSMALGYLGPSTHISVRPSCGCSHSPGDPEIAIVPDRLRRTGAAPSTSTTERARSPARIRIVQDGRRRAAAAAALCRASLRL